MAQKSDSMNGKEPAELRAEMALTRADLDSTIEALHGRLNPTVLKEQLIDSFYEVKQTITDELKQQFADAKVAVKEELADAKVAVKEELQEAKQALKSEVAEELHLVKVRFDSEIENAKTAVRAATIGKVENMMHDAKDKLVDAKDKLVETGGTMFDTMKANPIPLALMGAGVAWWFASSRMRARAASRKRSMAPRNLVLDVEFEGQGETRGEPAETFDKIRSGSTRAARMVGEKVSAAAHIVGDTVTEAAHDVGDAVAGAAVKVGGAAKAAARATRDQSRVLKRRSVDAFQANPIAVGAAVLAVGTAIGLAFPRTQREDEVLGGVRDGLVEKVEGLAHDAFGKIEDATEGLFEAKREDDTERAASDEEPSAQSGQKNGARRGVRLNGLGADGRTR